MNVLKKAFAFILFAALLAIVVLKVYDIIRWKDTNGDYTSTTEQLYNTEDNLIDVVFVGSSHVYCDIYPAFIWEKSGIAAFDMSVSGQDKDSAYHHLKELLKTQSPKVVFVDLYPLFSDRIGIEGNVYRNMLALKTSENSYSLLKDYSEKDDINVNDFFFRWPIVHTRYKELQRLDFVEFAPNKFLRGEQIIFEAEEVYPPYISESLNPSELSDTNLKWLNDLYDLSVAENFKFS